MPLLLLEGLIIITPAEKIFISGSAKYNGKIITELPEQVLKFINAMTLTGKIFLIGDCYGVDYLVQNFLKSINYQNVIIYHSGNTCRNNLNNWPEKAIQVASNTHNRTFYTAKDIAMSHDANHGLAIWDGISKGTETNIKNMMNQQKSIAIFRLDLNKFI